MADKLTAERQSKDKFFTELSSISADMIEEHGKDFAMGALIMAAQWIAQGQSGPQQQTEH